MLRLKAYLYSLALQAPTAPGESALGDLLLGFSMGMGAYASGGRSAARALALGLALKVARNVVAAWRGHDLRGKIVMLAARLILLSVLFGLIYGAVGLLKWLL